MGLNVYEQDYCKGVTAALLDSPLCYIFASPIDPNASWAGEYFRTIPNPMDLSTVLKKIESGDYATTSEWCRDMNLIWQNAMTFNKKPSLLYFTADFLQKKCEKKFAKIPHSQTEASMVKLEKAHRQLNKILAFELSPHSLVARVPPAELKYTLH
jgi:hypothetical protein